VVNRLHDRPGGQPSRAALGPVGHHAPGVRGESGRAGQSSLGPSHAERENVLPTKKPLSTEKGFYFHVLVCFANVASTRTTGRCPSCRACASLVLSASRGSVGRRLPPTCSAGLALKSCVSHSARAIGCDRTSAWVGVRDPVSP